MAADKRSSANAASEKTTTGESTPCYFFKLAPELRNRIYEYALLNKSEELIMSAKQPPPPLLRTCRQIRDEAGSLYYSSSKFLITNGEEYCLSWLKSLLPEARKRIKRLRLYTKCGSSGIHEAEYKDALLRNLRASMKARGMPDIELQVFVSVYEGWKMKMVWTSDPLRQWQESLNAL